MYISLNVKYRQGSLVSIFLHEIQISLIDQKLSSIEQRFFLKGSRLDRGIDLVERVHHLKRKQIKKTLIVKKRQKSQTLLYDQIKRKNIILASIVVSISSRVLCAQEVFSILYIQNFVPTYVNTGDERFIILSGNIPEFFTRDNNRKLMKF